MTYLYQLVLISSLFIIGIRTAHSQVQLKAGGLQLGIDKLGKVIELRNLGTNTNYSPKDSAGVLIQLVLGDKRVLPTKCTYQASRGLIQFQFASIGAQADIKVTQRPTHLVLELIKLSSKQTIDAIVWGPYSTTISKIVGEVVGIVRDEKVAIGMQVLNLKTLGGNYPNKEGSTWARGLAAEKRSFGSTLQAYAINRDRARLVDAWGGNFKDMPVAAIKGESVIGSKIALFSCEEPKTLDLIEQIELAEGLPHPTVNGTWFKRSSLFGKSYIISSFDETTVDDMIAYTKRAGLVSLYHEGPFKSWGHFILNPTQFPNGIAGIKKAAEKAHAAGLKFGVHTLSNFINTNDPYVTPVPDSRLSKTGYSLLTENIDESTDKIVVQNPAYFNQKENSLHAILIGKEIIRYRIITDQAPYTLLDCQRGAFGTKAASHQRGDTAGKLFDHPYNVFFPDINMQREVAGKLADFLNETGVDHLDFDGFEGGLASGQGDYGVELFANDVFEKVKHELLIGTSISKTYFWHICSYYNWGEPWYGGFNESMQQYRIDNQSLFERNFMPNMLGWYLLTKTTTLSEMEWMLARAAGYKAGFAMVASPEAVKLNPQGGLLLDAIREWERARNAKAFTDEQRSRLQNPSNDFHLSVIDSNQWLLQQISTAAKFRKENKVLQPGEPRSTSWDYEHKNIDQPIRGIVRAGVGDGVVKGIVITIDNYVELVIPFELLPGESIVVDGSKNLMLYDSLGKYKETKSTTIKIPVFTKGKHQLKMDAVFEGVKPPAIEFELKAISSEENVRSTLR